MKIIFIKTKKTYERKSNVIYDCRSIQMTLSFVANGIDF